MGSGGRQRQNIRLATTFGLSEFRKSVWGEAERHGLQRGIRSEEGWRVASEEVLIATVGAKSAACAAPSRLGDGRNGARYALGNGPFRRYLRDRYEAASAGDDNGVRVFLYCGLCAESFPQFAQDQNITSPTPCPAGPESTRVNASWTGKPTKRYCSSMSVIQAQRGLSLRNSPKCYPPFRADRFKDCYRNSDARVSSY